MKTLIIKIRSWIWYIVNPYKGRIYFDTQYSDIIDLMTSAKPITGIGEEIIERQLCEDMVKLLHNNGCFQIWTRKDRDGMYRYHMKLRLIKPRVDGEKTDE